MHHRAHPDVAGSPRTDPVPLSEAEPRSNLAGAPVGAVAARATRATRAPLPLPSARRHAGFARHAERQHAGQPRRQGGTPVAPDGCRVLKRARFDLDALF